VLGGLLIGGPLVAALGLTGVVATTVSGAVTGAVAGGLIGALVGLGLPKEDAEYYNEAIEKGGILLAVQAHDGDQDRVEELLGGPETEGSVVETKGIATATTRRIRIVDRA